MSFGRLIMRGRIRGMSDGHRSTFGSVAVIIALLAVLFIGSVVGVGIWSYLRGVEVPAMPQSQSEGFEALEGNIVVDPNEIGPETTNQKD
jgi:hypothetical protein